MYGYDENKDGDFEDPKDQAPYVSFYRNQDYCADEQSCIVENDDGTCRFYGYCTEERRTWNFNADNCNANFNTCQTFAGRDGVTASYLKNSLDYNGCNIDNVGCWWYCQDYDEVSGNRPVPLQARVIYPVILLPVVWKPEAAISRPATINVMPAKTALSWSALLLAMTLGIASPITALATLVILLSAV